MEKAITFGGLDAHKLAINVSVFFAGQTRPVEWQVANERAAVRRMVRKVLRQASGGEVRFCYEAGAAATLIRHAQRDQAASILPLAVAVVGPAFRASLVTPVRGASLDPARCRRTEIRAVHLAAVARAEHVEHRSAGLATAQTLSESDLPAVRLAESHTKPRSSAKTTGVSFLRLPCLP